MYDIFAFRGRVKATSVHPKAHQPTTQLTTWIAGSSTRGSAIKEVRLQECGDIFQQSCETEVTNDICYFYYDIISDHYLIS